MHGYVQRICFKTGPPGRVGAELDWLVARREDPLAVVPLEQVRALLAGAQPFPGGSRLTPEPGGQVELSSDPPGALAGCLEALDRDVAHLQAVLDRAGLVLLDSAADPFRPPLRQLHQHRYDAMAAYYQSLPGSLGEVMMASTAAVQVNLDAGVDATDVVRCARRSTTSTTRSSTHARSAPACHCCLRRSPTTM